MLTNGFLVFPLYPLIFFLLYSSLATSLLLYPTSDLIILVGSGQPFTIFFLHSGCWAHPEKNHTLIWMNVLQIHEFLCKLAFQEHQAISWFVSVLSPVSCSGCTICSRYLYVPYPSCILSLIKNIYQIPAMWLSQ